jgi:FkbM family methyltransferase
MKPAPHNTAAPDDGAPRGRPTPLQRAEMAALTAYLKYSPLGAGRWRVHRRAKLLARRRFLHAPEARVRIRRVGRMTVRLDEFFGWHAFFAGVFEPATSYTIRKLLTPGDCALDVGANVGYFTMLMARRVGPKGRVIAFEPLPATLQRLRRNLDANRLTGVEVRAHALSDRPGEAAFFPGPDDHSGVSSLLQHDEADASTTVRCVRLDDELDSIPTVSLIKVDIEGAELRALRGMRALLERDQPDLVVEVTDRWLSHEDGGAQALVASLESLGYRGFRVLYDHQSNPWRCRSPHGRIGPTLAPLTRSDDFPRQFNALFTQRSSLPAALLAAERTAPAGQPPYGPATARLTPSA